MLPRRRRSRRFIRITPERSHLRISMSCSAAVSRLIRQRSRENWSMTGGVATALNKMDCSLKCSVHSAIKSFRCSHAFAGRFPRKQPQRSLTSFCASSAKAVHFSPTWDLAACHFFGRWYLRMTPRSWFHSSSGDSSFDQPRVFRASPRNTSSYTRHRSAKSGSTSTSSRENLQR